MTFIRSIRANVYILIPCNEVFLWKVKKSSFYSMNIYKLALKDLMMVV